MSFIVDFLVDVLFYVFYRVSFNEFIFYVQQKGADDFVAGQS